MLFKIITFTSTKEFEFLSVFLKLLVVALVDESI